MQKKEKKEIVVILDTNLIVSHIWGSPNAALIMQAVRDVAGLVPVISLEMLQELKETLAKPKIEKKISKGIAAEYIKELMVYAKYVEPRIKVSACDDPDDNMLFECAVEARADYIISGDKAVLAVKEYEGTKVITPQDFIQKVLNVK